MKIGITGCGGRMGQMLIQEVVSNSYTFLSGGTEKSNSPFISEDLGELSGIQKLNLYVGENPDNLFDCSDVVIDFTAPAASLIHLGLAVKYKTALILGTTGFNDAQINVIKESSKETVIVHASNFSVGVNLLLGLANQASSILDEEYDIEIFEMHHREKVDAPSGTALAIGEAVANGRNIDLTNNCTKARDGITGRRTKGSIGFATLRGGAVVGEHNVLFVSDGEHIELGHKANDRRIFATGAVRAALWAKGQKNGYYSMRDVLGFN